MRKDRLRKPATKVYIIRPANKNIIRNNNKSITNNNTVKNNTSGGCGCRRKNRA